MYSIKVDGQVLWTPALSDAYQIVNPILKKKVNKSDTLSFTMMPNHPMRNMIHKMKSIITAEWDGEEIFRGRVLEDRTDLFNQTEVICESELSYLLDSLLRPYEFDGSAADFLRMLITTHNEQVDADKQFTVGTISAVGAGNVFNTISTDYKPVLEELRLFLLQRYGGYLRVRRENGIRYIDYLNKYDESTDQTVEFGVNILDIERNIDAQELFTVLVPISNIEDSFETLTIESVNNGLDYIENQEAIAKYGRIVRRCTWHNVRDAATLLELGREKLQKASTLDTFTIKAIDLHLLNVNTDSITLGATARILSAPHGIDRELECSAMVVDMQNPENTRYTFGKQDVQGVYSEHGIDKDSFADSIVSNNKQNNENSKQNYENSKQNYLNSKHIKETEDGLNIYIQKTDEALGRISSVEFDMDAANATIALKANVSEVNELGTRVSNAEVTIDGMNARIDLKASIAEVNDVSARVSNAEVAIDGMNARIDLKASQATVDEQGVRLTSAEVAIDGANAEIALKVSKNGVISAINMSSESVDISASRINLSGYVTASQLSAEVSSINTAISTKIVTSSLSASTVSCSSLTLSDASVRLRTGSFVTAVTLPTVSGKYITYMDDTMDVTQQYVLTGFTQGEVTTSSVVYAGT